MNDGLELSVRDIVIRRFLVSLHLPLVQSIIEVAIHDAGRQRGWSSLIFLICLCSSGDGRFLWWLLKPGRTLNANVPNIPGLYFWPDKKTRLASA